MKTEQLEEKYKCDPTKNTSCKKTHCYMYGGECSHTSEKEYKRNELTLLDTIEGMLSDDYKERFKAEYTQLKIRYHKLCIFLDHYKHNELNFKPKTSIQILELQSYNMYNYMSVLKERARIEGINLD